MLKGSWKTGLLGWLVLIGALVHAGIALLDNDPATVLNMSEILAALTGVGLIAARDDNKTSEQVGAK